MRFKSYYVVWKLNRSNILCYSIIQFKSYYVVWKPDRMFFQPYRKIRLNRTMQYGNIFNLLHICLGKKFKSYYVVWKLFFCLFFHFSQIPFKSYYVVWKLFFSYPKTFLITQFKSYYVVWKRDREFYNTADDIV